MPIFITAKVYGKLDINIVTNYLTSISQACTGYEMVDPRQEHKAKLALTISHPTSASGMIVLSKMLAIFRKLKNVKRNMPHKFHIWLTYL